MSVGGISTKGLGGLQVDHELEFCRLLDWQIRWLIALKYLLHKQRQVPIQSGAFVAVYIRAPASVNERKIVTNARRCLRARSATCLVEKVPCAMTASARAFSMASKAPSTSFGPVFVYSSSTWMGWR
jgi:hypothetical protein